MGGQRSRASSAVGELLNPVDLASIALTAASEADAWAVLAPRFAYFGFDHCAYIFGVRTDTALHAFPIKELRFGELICPAWHAYMTEHPESSRDDPVGRRMVRADASFMMAPSIGHMPALSAREDVAVKRQFDFGLTAGAAISSHDRHRGDMAGLMASETGNPATFIEACQQHLGAIRIAVAYMSEGFRLRTLATDGGARLAPRERECLLWAGAGKSTKEIAEILSLSSATVNEYFANAMKKLGAASRAQAVSRALMLDLIRP